MKTHRWFSLAIASILCSRRANEPIVPSVLCPTDRPSATDTNRLLITKGIRPGGRNAGQVAIEPNDILCRCARGRYRGLRNSR